ncbi:MAG: MATE family efflux transporter [Myxococcota bacterium]
MVEARPAGGRSTLQRILFERDHTEGSLLVSIAVLALPALLMGLAGGAGFQTVELFFVGQLGPAGTAAFGVASQALGQLPFLIGFGIAVAAQMYVAQLVGSRRLEEANRVAAQAFVLAFAICLGIACLGQFPEALLRLLSRDADVIAAGEGFVRVAYTFMFAQIFGMIFSFVLSGAGETTTPLLLSLISTPLTIALEYALIFGHFGAPALGLVGIAIAVAAASLLSVTIAFALLLGGRCRIELRAQHLVPDPRVMRSIASRAWQPALHMIVPTLLIVGYMTLSGRYGTEVQAAYTIGLRIESLPVFLSFPIANACATLVGQNLGAGRPARAWSAIGAGYALELLAMGTIALVLLLARAPIVGFFTQDPAVIALASEYLLFGCVNVVLIGIYFVSFRALQGAGDMTTPMLVSLAAAVGVALPVAWILTTQTELGPRALWIANLAFTATNTALATGWLALGRWARPSGA